MQKKAVEKAARKERAKAKEADAQPTVPDSEAIGEEQKATAHPGFVKNAKGEFEPIQKPLKAAPPLTDKQAKVMKAHEEAAQKNDAAREGFDDLETPAEEPEDKVLIYLNQYLGDVIETMPKNKLLSRLSEMWKLLKANDKTENQEIILSWYVSIGKPDDTKITDFVNAMGETVLRNAMREMVNWWGTRDK